MSNNGEAFVSFGNGEKALIVKCVIAFDEPVTSFRFSLSTLLTIDNISADADSEWKIIKEWQPQWRHKSNEIEVSGKTPMQELTIEYHGHVSNLYHGCYLGWCNIIQDKRIALSAYSAWTIEDTSVPVRFIFKIAGLSGYFVINSRYDDVEKLWVYGETNHEEGNIIALKKGHYYEASTGDFRFYYMNEDEKEYAHNYVSNYDNIMAYFASVFGEKNIGKMSIVSLGIKVGNGAYIRKELMVIEKINVVEDKEKIRQNVIGLLGHELGHNWFTGADTTTWEDWLNETGAEWAALLYILSLDEKEFFESHLSRAKEKYKETPIIKSPDGKRPVDGIHIRGVMMFYEIYQKYGIETITAILKILSAMKLKTTENFLFEVKNNIDNDIAEKIEQGLTVKDYSDLFRSE